MDGEGLDEHDAEGRERKSMSVFRAAIVIIFHNYFVQIQVKFPTKLLNFDDFHHTKRPNA